MIPQTGTVCLKFLARHAPAASCGVAKDATPMYVTPTSLGGVTPRFHCTVVGPNFDGLSPSANNTAEIDPTPTSMRGLTAASSFPTAVGKGDPTAVSEGDHHVRFRDPVESFLLVSGSRSVASMLSEDGKSIGERSFSTCSTGRFFSSDLSIKNTFIHMDGEEPDSDDDCCIPVQKSKSLPTGLVLQQRRRFVRSAQLERSDSDLDTLPLSTPMAQGLPSAEAAKQAGLPSAGSFLHPGNCKPCAFYWKPEGCQNGAECYHCHACPQDEIKQRKKGKIEKLKAAKRLAKREQGA